MPKPMHLVIMSISVLIIAFLFRNDSFASINQFLQKQSSSLPSFNQTSPNCGDDDVKQLTMEIVEETIKDGMTLAVFGATRQTGITYAKVLKAAETEPQFHEKLKEVDNAYRSADPKLKNIRTTAIDDRLSITECAANVIYSDGTTVPIQFRTSITTDNELYVEVLD